MIFTVFPLFYSKSQMLTLLPLNHDILFAFILSYLILSFLSLSYLLRSHDQDGKQDLIQDDYLQFRAIPKITTRTSRSMDPLSGGVPPSQELPVPPDRLHRIQLLPGKHLRRRTPQSVRRPEFYQSPDSSLIFFPRQVHLERRSHRGNWLPTGETTAKGSLRGAQLREMGPSLGGPGEKSEKPGRKPITVGDK